MKLGILTLFNILIKKGKFDFRSIKLPSYLPKNSYFNLIIGQIRIKKDGCLDVPLSPTFKRTYGKITIKVPIYYS